MSKTKKTYSHRTIFSLSSLFTRGSLWAFLFLILISIPLFSQASINPQINYQGKLTDASGNSVSDGSYNIVFKIYDTASGGVPLWTGNYTAANGNPVSISSGVFSILLGSGTGNSLNLDFSAAAYYLGVIIGTDPEMAPRKRIGSVPQAYNANNLIGDGYIKITGLPTGTQVSEGTVYINPSSAASTYTLLGAAVNGSQKMKLDASGNLTVEGSIGIGTTSPTSLLTVGNGDLFQVDTNGDIIKLKNLTYSWPSSHTANGVLTNNGSGTLTWATVGASGITADSLDFTEFQDTLDLDANLILNQAAYTWTQNFTGTTTYGLTYNANSLTSGGALSLASTATGFTGTMAGITLSGNNAANTGTLLKVSSNGVLNAGTVAMITNLGTGLSFRVNDETGDADATPFVIDASGNVGIGTTTPNNKLYLSGGSFKIDGSGNLALRSSYAAPGILSVYVNGKYAYIIDTYGLEILDVSNSSNPVLVGQLAVPSLPADINCHSNLTYDNTITIQGKFAYIGSSCSFHIVDISNPSSPAEVSYISDYYNGTAGMAKIIASGRYLYSAQVYGLTAIDAGDPASPKVTWTGPSWWGWDIAQQGKYVYEADGGTGLVIFDVSNPATPVVKSTLPTGYPSGIAVSGRYVYLVDWGTDIKIIDVNNPSSPQVVNTLMGNYYKIKTSGNYAYAVGNGTGIVDVYDISDPVSPVKVGSYASTGSGNIFISGENMYVIADGRLEIVGLNFIETPAIYAGNIKAGDLDIENNGVINNSLSVGASLNVGHGGISSDGSLMIRGTSTPNIFLGSVGIGTTSPAVALDVNGSVNVTGYYAIGSSTVFSIAGSANTFVGVDAGKSNTIGTNGVFVGNGAGYSNTTSSLNTFVGNDSGHDNTTGASNTFVGRASGRYNTTGTDNTFFGLNSGFFNTTGSSNTMLGNHAGFAYTTGSGNLFVGLLSGFYDFGGSSSYNVRLGPESYHGAWGVYNRNSTIAIGYDTFTTADNQMVVGSSYANGLITDSYWGSGVTKAGPSDFTFNASGGSGTNNTGAGLIMAGGKGTGNAAGGSIIFKTSDALASGATLQSLTEKMRITASGNVGIGTASPGSALDIKGTLRLSGSTSGYVGLAPATVAGSTTYTLPGADGTNGQVLSTNGTGALSWTTAGGTLSWSSLTNPSANLALTMGAYTSTFTYNAATGANNLFNLTDTASNTGTGYLLNVTTATGSTLKPFHVSADGTEALTVLANGYVGIGTASPSYKLDVSGSGQFTGIPTGTGVSQGTLYVNPLQMSSASAVSWSAKSAWNAPDVGALATPAFADLDNDGDYDLLIGEGNSGVSYAYENTGTASSPAWTAKPAWNAPDVGVQAAPAFADLDNDGDYDLLIGESAGVSYAYENTGTASSPVWTAKSAWNAPDVGDYTNPAFADLDNDDDYDLLIGILGGASLGYENTGSASSPVWTAKSAWNAPDVGNYSIPAFADLDNDGDYDLLIGEGSGISYGYENTGSGGASGNTLLGLAVNGSEKLRVTGAGAINAQGYITSQSYGSFTYNGDLAALTVRQNGAGNILDLKDGATTIFTAKNGGNVGIGTTSPGSALDIKGTLRLSGSTSGYVGLAPAAAAGSTTYTLPNADGTNGQVLSTNGSGALSWTTAGGSLAWSNLTNPSANLALTMGAYTSTFTYNAATGANNLFNLTDTASNTGTGYLLNVTTATGSTLKPFHVSAAGTEALTVLANGNVGIGTASPAYKLDVSGSGQFTGIPTGSGVSQGALYVNPSAMSSASAVSWSAKPTWNAPYVGSNTVPAFADLDNDGDKDMLIGASDGICYGYENTGTASSPVWTAKPAWNAPDVGPFYASPAFADLDKDGDYDLLIGEQSGTSYGYENTGTVTSPVWTVKTAWNTLDVGLYAHPALADLDNDGDYDLLIGENGGISFAYENTGSGGASGNTLLGLAVNGSEKLRITGTGSVNAQGYITSQSYGSFTYNGDLAALTVRQNGIGNILDLKDGATTIFTVKNGGNIGIGTTSPTALLHLDGSAGKVSLEINSNETTAASNVLMLRSDVASANDPIFRVQADGAVFADGAYTGTGADYAEYFATKDTDLKSGEAVCVDTQKDNAVKRCARSGDNDIMGIVSSHPSIVGNSADGREKDPNYKVIGMLGQITGNVSGENGSIQIGDSLTSANTPGYLRKADAGESTVGVALQKFDGKQGSIQILISRRNKSLTVEKVEEAVTQRIADMNVQDQVDKMIADAATELAKNTETQLMDIGGRVITLETLINGYATRIKTQEDLAAILQAQIDELKQLANTELNLAQIGANKTDIDYLKLVLGLDRAENGSVHLLGNLEADEVVAGVFTVKIVDEEKKTIGEATIKAGESLVIVETKAISKNSKVFVTSETPVEIGVNSLEDGKSFKIEIGKPVEKDMKVDWWIVEEK